MTQRLHLVPGGDLVDPSRPMSGDVGASHVAVMFPGDRATRDPRQAGAHRSVDAAHMRSFIPHVRRSRDAEAEVGPTGKPGD